MSSVILLPLFLTHSPDPIDFKCKRCKHSFKDHLKDDNPTTQCLGGWFGGCKCRGLIIDKKQIEEAEKKIQELRETLFKYYDQAIKKQVSVINRMEG